MGNVVPFEYGMVGELYSNCLLVRVHTKSICVPIHQLHRVRCSCLNLADSFCQRIRIRSPRHLHCDSFFPLVCAVGIEDLRIDS